MVGANRYPDIPGETCAVRLGKVGMSVLLDGADWQQIRDKTCIALINVHASHCTIDLFWRTRPV
jgi:hypothetical protein